MEKHIVKVEFENRNDAEEFALWFNGAGEQHYWQHCEDADLHDVGFAYPDALTIVATRR